MSLIKPDCLYCQNAWNGTCRACEVLQSDEYSRILSLFNNKAKTSNTFCNKCGAGDYCYYCEGAMKTNEFHIGDHVLKFSGDYQLEGTVVAVFQTTKGNTRYVVEHSPGFLHIYSGDNLKKVINE